MKPPMVNELTSPSAHRTNNMTAIVHSIGSASSMRSPEGSRFHPSAEAHDETWTWLPVSQAGTLGPSPDRRTSPLDIEDVQEGLRGVAQRARLDVQQADHPLDVQLLDLHLAHQLPLDLV